jgi:hypothetical protein
MDMDMAMDTGAGIVVTATITDGIADAIIITVIGNEHAPSGGLNQSAAAGTAVAPLLQLPPLSLPFAMR